MKNEDTGYRRDLCARLGIDPPSGMETLDERARIRKERAGEERLTHQGKTKRRLVRDGKSERNDPLDARYGYQSSVGFDHDSRGHMLVDSDT
ncbi:hypothetical protein CYMTET_23024 [Cymbomonas tetramitiformis]|uniref:Uncharacterized protein n=1 Tax=Cymbomonas tetramitiformis TaxID=36881 RepID=A0AAE0L1C9_9CHLO|nr:hypothetical protein CYMTET_23024 [Cymbomonas tetramitiformis]